MNLLYEKAELQKSTLPIFLLFLHIPHPDLSPAFFLQITEEFQEHG